jgi:serine/threonine protein kinase
VHYGLCLQGDELTDAQNSITPLHRAARYGRLAVVRILLEEVHSQALVDIMNARMAYDHTALHWACVYGHAGVVEELITRGCSTDLLNHRGKTAWDIAADYGNEDVLAVFTRFSEDSHNYEQLHQEGIRRARRPKVQDIFRDDIELDPVRLDLWSIEPFGQWTKVAEGTYGTVFDIIASPDVEVAGSRFRRIALKVPKQEGVAELKGEVESLAQLAHENVVQVLGMVYGKTPGSGEEKHWAMALEWCDLDLTKLLYEPELADPDGTYKPLASMCELMEQIAHGLTYIHEQGRPHLDLKPDNILLTRAPSGQHQFKHVYIAKLADFGMTYQDDAPATAQASDQLQRTHSPSANGGGSPADKDAIVPFGTWEYLSPECWKRKYGKPRAASDIFSLGLLMWEMLARSRISTHLLDADNPDHRVDEDGEVTLDVEAVPVLFVKGERPRHTGLQEEVREQRGWHVYYRLMQACWVSGIDERPTAALVAEALILAKSYAANATPEQAEKHIADLEAEVNSGGSVDANSADSVNGAAVISYDDFLAMVGLTDSRAELDEYLTSKDSNGKLEELKQYDEDDLEEEILDELELDEETKAIFHEQLKALKHSGVVADEQQVSEFDPAAVNAAARAAAEHEEQWPKWPALQTMLPGLRGLHEAAAQTLEEALAAKDIALACAVAAKDEELAAKDLELANALTAKEGELASVVAAKDLELVAQAGELAGALAELEQLRAQLGRIEGVPPQRE